MKKIAKSLLGGSIAFGLFSAVVPQADAALVYGVTEFGNTLISFDTSNTMDILNGVSIEGLANNDTIRAIDFRPATGQLYALGSSSRLYTINPTTGDATQVGSGRFSPLLNGSGFGMDFNPTVDRIRVTANTDQNLRIHPDTGLVVAVDGNLNYNAGDPNFGTDPNIVASAYTFSDTDALTGTTLYNIDSVRDVLVIQNPPNTGGLQTVGLLGIDATDRVGFDILTVGGTNTAYASVTLATPLGPESASNFYEINLTTGTATFVGRIGGGEFIRAIAVVPEPASVGLLAAGAAVLAGRRRRKA